MKPLDKDLSIITHVLSYCEQINETMERFGRSQDIFMSDKIYRNAVALCMEPTFMACSCAGVTPRRSLL